MLGKALLESMMILNKKAVVSVIRLKEMEFFQAKPSDLDGIVSVLRQTRGVEVAILLYELEPQTFKVSLRSKEIVDVSAVAKYYGGGGHVRAAGVTMKGSPHDVINNLTLLIERQLRAAEEKTRKMINGIVNIYKEKGYTSHDVVAVLRKVVGQKKIGHTGTLDPDATGVLPVCLGRATKVCELLTDHDKTYEALLLLGKTTDTQDISGEVLEERDPGDLTEEEVRSCIESFIGEYDQIPPMYSALKVNGKKLYELAREGKTVERKSRKVQIHGIRILEMNLPHVRMEVDCSKGTYIRTLCHDIGEKLQVGGCMEELERTKVGRFLKEDAVTLDEVRQKMEQGEGAELFTPLDQIFAELPAVTVTDAKAWMSYNGNDLPERFLLEKEAWTDGQEVRVYDSRKNFIGLYQYRAPKKLFHIKKMFLDPEAEKIEK